MNNSLLKFYTQEINQGNQCEHIDKEINEYFYRLSSNLFKTKAARSPSYKIKRLWNNTETNWPIEDHIFKNILPSLSGTAVQVFYLYLFRQVKFNKSNSVYLSYIYLHAIAGIDFITYENCAKELQDLKLISRDFHDPEKYDVNVSWLKE